MARHLEKVLRLHLDIFKNPEVGRDLRVDRLRQGRFDRLVGERMRRAVKIENKARLQRGQSEALEQIDKSPGASRSRDRLVKYIEQMLRALPGGDRIFVHVVAA